jgi:hypothetical protein
MNAKAKLKPLPSASRKDHRGFFVTPHVYPKSAKERFWHFLA